MSLKIAIGLPLALLTLAGCTLASGPMPGPSQPDPLMLARVASTAAYYLDLQNKAALSNLESDDLNGNLPASTGTAGSPVSASLMAGAWTYTLGDGTIVEALEITDDRGTATEEDDIVTITRTYRAWDGTTEKIEKIVRPVRPQSMWDGWTGNPLRMVQTGTVEEFLQGVRVKAGTLTATWTRNGTAVWASEIVKETEWVDSRSAVDRLVVVTEQGGAQTRTLFRTRLTPQGGVAVQRVAYEDLAENGAIYTKGVLDDGSYFIIRSPQSPRVVDQYTSAGMLWARNTETQQGRSTSAVMEYFDAAGNVMRTTEADFTARFLGDAVFLTRTNPADRSRMTLLISENEHGFSVSGERSFVVWFVGEAVNIYDSRMNLIAVVTFDLQGGALVTYAGGSSAAVAL